MRRFIAALIFSCVFFFSPTSFSIMLKIATASPDGTVWMEKMRQAAGDIEKLTSGRVQFRFYPGGIMGNDASVMRKINVKQLQGGIITGGGLKDVEIRDTP